MLQTNVDITFCVIVDVLANGQWIDWTFGQPGGVTRPVWTHPVSLGTGSGQKERIDGSIISGRHSQVQVGIACACQCLSIKINMTSVEHDCSSIKVCCHILL